MSQKEIKDFKLYKIISVTHYNPTSWQRGRRGAAQRVTVNGTVMGSITTREKWNI